MRGKVWTLGWALGMLIALSGGLVAQEVQTPSATLETVISLVQDNPYVPEKHVQVVSAFLATAIEQGAITPEQALQLLEVVGWAELTTEDALGFAARALELALIAVTAEGAAYDEVLSTLVEMAESEMLGPLASEEHTANALPGLATALLKSTDLTPDLLEEMEEAVLAGVPPGQVMRTVHSLIRAGAEEEEIEEAVEELVEGLSHHTPGHPGEGKPDDDEEDEHLGCTGCDDDHDEGHGPPPSLGKPDDDDDEEDEDEGHGTPPGKPSDDEEDEDEGHGRRGGGKG